MWGILSKPAGNIPRFAPEIPTFALVTVRSTGTGRRKKKQAGYMWLTQHLDGKLKNIQGTTNACKRR